MTDKISALFTLRPERRRIGTPQEMDEWLKLAEAEIRGLQAYALELENRLNTKKEQHMNPHQLDGAVWKKGSRSNGSGGNNCVEVAFLDNAVAVRDSKDPSGPALVFTPAEWTAFVESTKDKEFDLPA